MKLLVVEDEARMSRLLTRGLTEEGHLVDVSSTAGQATERVRSGSEYDLVILDWGLPDEDGLTLLSQWRAEGLTTPVLILSARGTVEDRIAGLKTGADDYLSKPFSFDELLARIDALHRRAATLSSASSHLGDVEFSRTRRTLSRGEVSVDLTGREYQLFRHLADRLGDICTRTEILAKVWGSDFDGDPNIVDVLVKNLRAKLELLAPSRLSIITVRKSGYRLAVAREP